MDQQTFLNYINRNNVFGFHNGVKLISCKEGYAEAQLDPVPESNSNIGFPHIHGGLLFAMADSVAGTAAMTYGHVCVTLNSSISYLKAATGGMPLIAIARKNHQGRSTGVYDVEITEGEKLIAKGTFTMFMRKERIDDVINKN